MKTKETSNERANHQSEKLEEPAPFTVSQRRLRVEEIQFPRSHGQAPLKAPYIRLKGRWLSERGFQTGQMVRVTPTVNGILITF